MKKRNVAALLIKPPGVMERVELDATSEGCYKHIHELIGDGFSDACAFRVGSRKFVAYCDDMGAYKLNLPFSVVLGPTVYRALYPIRGPLVITARDEMGETVPMTERDYQAITLEPPLLPWTFGGGQGFIGDVPSARIEGVRVLAVKGR